MATKQRTEGKKMEFKMSEVLAMWKYKSTNGRPYFSGSGRMEAGTEGKYIGFYNGKKKNPKEPDIRIYRRNDEGLEKDEFLSLWCNVSEKTGKKYLTGRLGDRRVVGFINEKSDGKRSYFSVYFSEEKASDGSVKEKKPDPVQEPIQEEIDDDLPF